MRFAPNKHWREFVSSLKTERGASQQRRAILAAHPDDETIGSSVVLGVNAMADAEHRPTHVMFLTDGAPQDSRLWAADFRGSREQYACMRRAEAERALARAGISRKQVHWLGGMDQEVIYSATELSQEVAAYLADVHIEVLITHPYEGGHPDHDAAALIASFALTQLPTGHRPFLAEMTSYHARNGECVTGEFLPGHSEQQVNISLSADERTRKQAMFREYESQQLVLGAFGTDRESFRPAPPYDFSLPPHDGKLWYECMEWPMSGKQWCASAAESIENVQEFLCSSRS